MKARPRAAVPSDRSQTQDKGADRPEAAGTRTLVVVPTLSGRARTEQDPTRPQRSAEARLEEAVGLAAAINLTVVSSGTVTLSQLKPATLFGSGKVDELAALVKAEEIELVVVDHPLSPIQQRNLERAFGAKVIDRTGLILEIFGDRARTAEGRLQVELAHLRWQKSRLVRSWTHLERQRGGFGFLGGPGETQIEADRRLIQERIARLEKDLEQVRRTRDLHRKQRRRVPQPVVALVGYTNAGKSTLFNRLTRSAVFAEDQLFATLDPTLRKVTLPHGGEAILSDTVGFISDLPTHLVAAFRATLEEVAEADLILHVRDISHEDSDAQAADVAETLALLGIQPGDRRIIEVWNKIDRIDPVRRAGLLDGNRREGAAIAVSALTGDGIDALFDRIEDRITEDRDIYDLTLPTSDGVTLAWLYRSAEVLERHDEDARIRLRVRIAEKQRERFRTRCKAYLSGAAQ